MPVYLINSDTLNFLGTATLPLILVSLTTQMLDCVEALDHVRSFFFQAKLLFESY
jgi:hypothetical protein